MRGFTSVFIILFLISFVSSSEKAEEHCPRENCMKKTKCESRVLGAECPNRGEVCCSVVKKEFQTHCRHFGGTCMNGCAKIVRRDAVDCPKGKVCCVLV